MANQGVGYVRQEAASLLAPWFLIRDAIEGEVAIKGQFALRPNYIQTMQRIRRRAEDYLPMPNPTDRSEENRRRYESYVKRAVWYNFTARTLDGLVGQIFLRPPVSTLPSQLDPLLKNADGEGLTLEQVAKRTAQSTLAYGRAGLLADYPPSQKDWTSPVEMAAQHIQPTIRHYYPWQVINWATRRSGGIQALSLVVLEEYNIVQVDDFVLADDVSYRVLKLDPQTGVYNVEIWGEEIANAGVPNQRKQFSLKEQYTPTDHQGQPFKEIPFTFVGAEANDIFCDRPPLYDLAILNIAHYRNSADYEEASFLTGQPTPVISGVTEQWVENVLHGAVELGSRASISLPVGATAHLLQASANQMPLEAMKLKEEQARALGAKLVQEIRSSRTATEVLVDNTSESSTLHNVAKNTSAGLEQTLTWAGRFVGATEEVKYQLNTEFEFMRLNANDRLAIVKLWQAGAIAFTEMRDVLRVDGTASLDDDEALEQIKEEQAHMATLGGALIADPFQAVDPNAPENAPAAGTVKAPQVAP